MPIDSWGKGAQEPSVAAAWAVMGASDGAHLEPQMWGAINQGPSREPTQVGAGGGKEQTRDKPPGPKFTQDSRQDTQTPLAQTGTGYPGAEPKQSSWAMGRDCRWGPRWGCSEQLRSQYNQGAANI